MARLTAGGIISSLRGAQRRSNPAGAGLDCFAALAMTIEMLRGAMRGLLAPLLLLLAVPAAAQDIAPLAWLEGRWQGPGTMFGNPSEAVLDVRPSLGGRFLEFSYRAGAFEGRAFYRPDGNGSWRATWFDNRGISFPILAALAERTLASDWGSAETERGRTVYRLRDDGRLEVVDSVMTPGGEPREFARHILSRDSSTE